MKFGLKTLADLALAGLAAATVAACASHPPPPPSSPIPPPRDQQEGPPPGSGEEAPPPRAGGPIPGSERDFVINIGYRVYFDFNAAEIRADADPVLDGQAAWLRRYPAADIDAAWELLLDSPALSCGKLLLK